MFIDLQANNDSLRKIIVSDYYYSIKSELLLMTVQSLGCQSQFE